MSATHVVNPHTGRTIKVDGPTYRALIASRDSVTGSGELIDNIKRMTGKTPKRHSSFIEMIYSLDDLIISAIDQQRFVDATFTVPFEALNAELQMCKGCNTSIEQKIDNKKAFAELKTKLTALLALIESRPLYPGLWKAPKSEGSRGMWQVVVKEYLQGISAMCQILSFTQRRIML